MPTINAVSFTSTKARNFKCPPDKEKVFLRFLELSGLALSATRGGRKQWVVSKKIVGTKEVFFKVLGDYSALSFEDAKSLAAPLCAACSQGNDPAKTIIEERQKRSVTFEDLYLTFISVKKRSWGEFNLRDYQNSISRISEGAGVDGPLAYFLSKPVCSINRSMIEGWLLKEAEIGRPTTTGRGLRHLLACLRWAGEHDDYEDLIDRRVLDSRSIRSHTRSGKARAEDTLDESQLALWYSGITTEISSEVTRAYLLAVLFTGCRRSEVLAMKWKHFDEDKNIVKINCKVRGKVEDGGGREIPVGDWLADLLKSLPRASDYIFHSSASGSGALVNPDKSYVKARNSVGLSVTIHGLRRTYSNMADRVGVPEEVQRFLQGHAASGVRERHYKLRSAGDVMKYQTDMERFFLEKLNILKK